jgi:flagellar motor switch protein FliM
MKQQIQSAEVELVAELAKAPATVEQLLSLKVGDFIELDMHQSIQAKVVGVPVFDCNYGTSNGKYALKVNQLLTTHDQGWLGEHNVS